MLAQFLSAKYSLIGLDFGETTLRAAQLRKTPGGFEIACLAQWERSAAVEQSSLHPPAKEGLRKLFHNSSFRGRSVVAAMNPPQVEFHVLEVPQAAVQGGENADKVIHWEIGLMTSLSADEIETRHWLLPPRPGNPLNAIGVSTRRDAITSMLELCQSGGLHCRHLETGATALHQFGRMLRHWADDEIWGILDLGSRQTRLLLSLGHTPLLIRHTGEGGASWTERIAEALQISQSAAEIQKKTHGIIVPLRQEARPSNDADSQDEVAAMLLSVLRSELNEMATEIKKSYEYVLATYPGRRVADLVLVGGGAGMPKLAEFLSGILGIQVRRCSAYTNNRDSRLQISQTIRPSLEEYATALGLAMRMC